MHVHCVQEVDLKSEFFWFDKLYKEKIKSQIEYLEKNKINKALVYILDEKAVSMDCQFFPDFIVMAILVDFRKPSAVNFIKEAKKAGFKGIKILTYEQRVVRKDYSSILKVAKEIEKQDMFLTICATFGGEDPFKYDALALARYLLRNSFRSPLILAHAGGSRIKEAVLMADIAPNVYFDTSFTTTYWRGSTVISDLVFAIKKFPDRFFFGSDSPNIDFNQAKKDSLRMLSGVPCSLKNKFFYNNAFNFFKKYE